MVATLSIIVPVLNESTLVTALLNSLQSFRQAGCELIVVDGGSSDNTVALATPLADSVVHAGKGRATQMNAGAALANNEVLLFLHVDTVIPASGLASLHHCAHAHNWGFFRVKLSGSQRLLRVVEWCMNARSRLTGIATGDQCLFVGRDLFHAQSGFPALPLMEDVAFTKSLKQQLQPVIIADSVTTSSRRWEQLGIIKTILLMWWLRLLYFFGVAPARLAQAYYGK